MIRAIGQNDVLEAILLMKKSPEEQVKHIESYISNLKKSLNKKNSSKVSRKNLELNTEGENQSLEIIDQIKELKDLYDNGGLNDEEFKKAKDKLLK